MEFSMIIICVIALIMDIRTRKIANWLIAVGLIGGIYYQILEKGILGIFIFAGGIFLPLVLLGILYYFRMIGAGDIKLLCVIGGYMGALNLLLSMSVIFFLAGLYSLIVMMVHKNFQERMRYFLSYITDYYEKKRWKPYLNIEDKKSQIYFTIPILIAVAFYICK